MLVQWRGVTCGSLTSSVHDKATTPGLTKHAKLSTWPLVMASSPAMPFHSQMIFFSPRYSLRAASIPSRPRAGFLLGWSRHSSVQIRVLQGARRRLLLVQKKMNSSTGSMAPKVCNTPYHTSRHAHAYTQTQKPQPMICLF